MQVILIGGGGHCKSCIDVVRSGRAVIAGYLSPQGENNIDYINRIGSDDWLNNPQAVAYRYLIAVGQIKVSDIRKDLFNALLELNLPIHTAISNYAVASPTANIGSGTIVMHKAVVNANATVGKNCIINTAALVEHDVVIGDHCHISTGAIVNGGVTIGAGSMIGSGAIVLPGVQIAPNTLIGAGAVVTKDIHQASTWAGIPARKI